MKFPKACKIEVAVSTDKYRWNMNNVYLDCEPEKPVLVATDGHILAMIPVEADKAEQGFVTESALKAARKLAKRDDTAEILCNGMLTMKDGSALPRPTPQTEGKSAFIDYRRAFPKPERTTAMKITINAALLSKLAEALGSEQVTLDIEAEESIIVVTPQRNDDGRLGLFMPLRK